MIDDPLSPEITTETQSIASDSMGKDLLGFIVQEMKALPKPWQQLSEHEQNGVLDRARFKVESIVNDAISILSGNGWVSVLADIEGIAIKDHIKVTLKVDRGNSALAMHELYGSRNQPCRVVLCSPESYTGGMDAIKGEADQRAMNLNVAEGEEEPLLDKAIEYVRTTHKTGISNIQRKFRIGYNRAARIIEELEQRSVLTAPDRAGNRKVIDPNEAGPTG
jgi:DNA segregation ATPase FtsK/SpoIIIE-like protein